MGETSDTGDNTLNWGIPKRVAVCGHGSHGTQPSARPFTSLPTNARALAARAPRRGIDTSSSRTEAWENPGVREQMRARGATDRSHRTRGLRSRLREASEVLSHLWLTPTQRVASVASRGRVATAKEAGRTGSRRGPEALYRRVLPPATPWRGRGGASQPLRLSTKGECGRDGGETDKKRPPAGRP